MEEVDYTRMRRT